MGANHSHALDQPLDLEADHGHGHDHALDLDLAQRQGGNNKDNRLVGTTGSDFLDGRAGADLLNGRAGNDLLKGGRGADVYLLSKGHDQIRGYSRRDSILLSQELLDAGLKPADVTIKGFERNKRTWIELSYRLDGESHSTLIPNPGKQVEISADRTLLDNCDPPVALRAGSTVCNDVVPPGMIAAWEGSSAPSGWLKLQGGSFSSSQYPELYRALGSTSLPDYRNRFLVQYGYSSSAKAATTNGSNNAAIGSKLPYKTALPSSKFQFSSQSHSFRYGKTDKKGGGTSSSRGWRRDDPTNTSYSTTSSGSHTHRVTGGDSTTRPNAYAVNWIIKADQQSCSTVENILPQGIILATTSSVPSGWNVVGDLNNRYPVGAGSAYTLKRTYSDSTALPSTAFTVTNPGTHTHKIGSSKNSAGGSGFTPIINTKDGAINNVWTVNIPSHSHSFQTGGDSETRPDSVKVRWIKKTATSGVNNGYATALPSGVIAAWQSSASSIQSHPGWQVQSNWAGRYLRGATSSLGSTSAYQTAKPSSAFSLASDGAHSHKYGGGSPNISGSGDNYNPTLSGSEVQSSVNTHNHQINGGGDFTTRPDSVVVNYAKRTSSSALDVCPAPSSKRLSGSLLGTNSNGVVYDASATSSSNGEAINPSTLNIAYQYDINRGDLTGDRCSTLSSSIPYSITGTNVADTIEGGSGDDTLNGGGGDDVLDGKLGDATLNGGVGMDRYVLAYQNNQTVTIQDWDVVGNDFFEDLILPSDQHFISRIEEDQNNSDQLSIKIEVAALGDSGQRTTGTTFLQGISFGSDTDFPQSLTNLILGTSTDDDFTSKALMGGKDGFFVGDHDNPNDDVMVGGDGIDVLDGGGGDDTLYGGEGLDIFHLATDDHDNDRDYLVIMDFSIEENESRDVLYLDDGYEIKAIEDVDLQSSPTAAAGVVIQAGPIGTDSLADGGITGLSFLEGISLQELELNWDRDDVENVIIGTKTHDQATDRSLFGGALDLVDGQTIQLFAGTDADEIMFGREDDDQLEAGMGDDTLDGGEGADTLIGGPGADEFWLRSGTAVVDGGDGNDLIEIQADVAALGLEEVRLGDGSDRFINEGAVAVEGAIDFGAGNDRFETTTYLQTKELNGGDGRNDELILYGPPNEALVDQLADMKNEGFAIKNFETIRQLGGSWAFDGSLEGVDLLIDGGTIQANLEEKTQIAITMDTLQFNSDEGEFVIDASNVVDDLRGRWRLIRTRRPMNNLDQLVAATVLQIGDERQSLGLNDPLALDCAPYVFEMTQNSRGTALFLDVSL